MADFSRYTNYRDDAGVSGVVFGANATVLEVELNEMQEIQKQLIRDFIKYAIGDGISDINKLVYKDKNVSILADCGVIADGYCINCTGLQVAVTNGIAYLQIWEEVIDNSTAFKEHGNQQSAVTINNWGKDPRSSIETTKRKVIKYTLSTSQVADRINIPIASVVNGVMTKLVKEVNLSRLHDRVDAIDTYDMRDVYGVEIDYQTKEITRLASSIGKNGGTDFDNIRAFDRHRCLIAERDGSLISYLDGSTYPDYYNKNTGLLNNAVTATDGTQLIRGDRVNIMVEQNKFYYKVVPVQIDKIYADDESSGYHVRKARYYISDTYKPGFKVHPAFVKTLPTGATLEFDKIYIGAYKSVAYDSAYGLTNDTTYEDNAEDLDFASGGLTSVSGKVPVSGLYYPMTMNNIRRLLTNMDENGCWRMKDVTVMSMDILLFLVEYATLNAQSILGRGCVAKEGDSRFNLANITGGTESLGNKSSSASVVTNGVDSISYRGEEDIYGGLFEFIEGFIADNVSKWSNTLHIFGSYPKYDDVNFYQDMGMSGFISAFGYNYDHDWMFIPTEANGSAIAPIGDTVSPLGTYDGTGYVLAYGGNHNSGDNAGICNLRLVLDTNDVSCGSRIIYFPYKLGTNIG